MNLALVQYTFDVEEHPVIPRPHANSSRSESYVRTMPSTLKKLKSVATNLTPKFALRDSLTTDIMSAGSAGALPRNRQQVADLRRRREEKEDRHTLSKKKDPLYAVMLMCKESEGGKAQDSFVRIVTGAPEPMTVLTCDWSLYDIERFCTRDQCTVLSIDPTFNLGAFDVTVTTYRHLLKNSVGKHPVFVGPIFVHQRKKFESYYFFASSLVGLKLSLRNLRAFGTDGEKALYSAFHTVFERATHLRCFLHFKGNLEEKLREYDIPKHVRIEFLRDVFGNPSDLEDGIVDADSDGEYEAMVQSLQVVWDERERMYNNPPQFYDCFVRNYKSEIRCSMLKKRRIAAGLGNPPDPFYTNDVESQNNVIKHQMNYRPQELPDFISSMKKMVDNQKKEIERAAAGIGEYRLVEDYKHLATETRKFVQMSEKQREKLIRAIFTVPLNDLEDISPKEITEECMQQLPSHETSQNFLRRLPIPVYLADKVWDESTKMLASEGCICPSPGCSNKMEWLVQSCDARRKSPYFVECRKNGQIICEQSCGVYKSSKLCVHTVTVARRNNVLSQYLRWLLKQKAGTLNLSKLAAVDMPTGSGKKKSGRKASEKKSTSVVKAIVEGSEGKHTYRVNPKGMQPPVDYQGEKVDKSEGNNAYTAQYSACMSDVQPCASSDRRKGNKRV